MSRTYANLQFEIRNHVAFVTIDRPHALNALDRKTLGELDSAFGTMSGDSAVRVVVLRGAGDRAFAAGADINELGGLDEAGGAAFAREGQRIFARIESFPKPVIAAVNGYALGAGCELAMACSFRVASENAVLGQPEVRLGLIPGYGGTQRLPRLVGRGRALCMLLTAEYVPADEALRIGLVDRVVPLQELDSQVDGLARGIVRNAPIAVAACLEAAGEGMELEARLFGKCCGTSDMKEGTRAFLEKREATFRGE